jgi:hypothetical protein
MKIPKRFFLILAAILILPASAAGEEARTIFYNFEGRVHLLRNNKGVMADYDLAFQKGDILRIEPESFLDVTMHYLAAVKFMPDSEAVVVNCTESNMHFNLKKGSVKCNVKSLSYGGEFWIETPLAIVEVREMSPSQFMVQILRDQKGKMICVFSSKKGTLDIQSKVSSSETAIYENQTLEIHENGFASSPHQITAEEEEAMSKLSSIYVVPKPD